MSASAFRGWLRRRRIGVLMGGLSAERPISLKTGTAVLNSLRRRGFKPRSIDAKGDLPAQLRRQKIDFAYIALHGPGGEDGSVQGLLEWMKIPYTGSGVLASALAMDKVATKRILKAFGLPTAPSISTQDVRQPGLAAAVARLGYPVVVKPASQGSAIGISVVQRALDLPQALKNAFRFDVSVLIESFLEGPEVTIGVLGDEPLPVIEIVPANSAFYDFKAKYSPGGSRHILPARISSGQRRRSQHYAVKACQALGTRAAARVDFIIDKRHGPTILEVNTIPGMTETSLLPEAARAVGIDFDALVLKIAELSVGPAR